MSQDEPIKDPFRRGLGYAIQWYDALRRRPDDMVEQALNECIPLVIAKQDQLTGDVAAEGKLHCDDFLS